MAQADIIFQQNVRDILEKGVWQDPKAGLRTRWADGQPAKAKKIFGLVNRYHLQEEFPILTVRKCPFHYPIREMLWIWQKHSNRVADLGLPLWDAWAKEDGTIGKAYGYQLGIPYRFAEGESTIVDHLLYLLKHDPNSRRMVAHMYNYQDLADMALEPCAYSLTLNVTGHTLNGLLNQRSQDMMVANSWNVVQYACLLHLFAQVSGLVPGDLVHVIADAHIYDRHMSMAEDLLQAPSYPAPEFSLTPAPGGFYAYTEENFHLAFYQYGKDYGSLEVAE